MSAANNEDIDWELFDAVEVHPCLALDRENQVLTVEECQSIGIASLEPTDDLDHPDIHCWSVFLHFNPEMSENRGIYCIADSPTRGMATSLAQLIESTHFPRPTPAARMKP
ncbi:hypothetical protein ACTOWA_00620 [Herbaspirillum seropedicae]|uniref:hypothetical protein n=1 Tax=Herbaspirillum seropedicae TaxID=964 RepID=UPI00285D0250|nr:hypothetical protein [Herbaspirillum seropedicae]MDR6397901.1 hypothetical protein [Herbaspirillum seropedicae]